MYVHLYVLACTYVNIITYVYMYLHKCKYSYICTYILIDKLYQSNSFILILCSNDTMQAISVVLEVPASVKKIQVRHVFVSMFTYIIPISS